MSKHPDIGGSYPIRDIALNSINLSLHPNRLRELRPEKVAEIAEFMQEVGLINPITVWQKPHGGYQLLAGEHRLHAAMKLKWKSIKCFVRNDLGEDGAALIEVDENLRRADLTPEEMRAHLNKRREIWEKRKAECGTPRPTSKANKGFAAETAAATGMSKRQINRIVAEPKPEAKSKQPKPKQEQPNTGCDYDPDELIESESEAVSRHRGFLHCASAEVGFHSAKRHAEWFIKNAPDQIDMEMIDGAGQISKAWDELATRLVEAMPRELILAAIESQKRASTLVADGQSEVPLDDPHADYPDLPEHLDRRRGVA